MIDNRNLDNIKKLNRRLEVAGNIVFIIFMIIILSLIFITAQSKITGQEPALFGYRLYIVDSGSMSPTIKTNSIIIVEESLPKGIEAGDVITYYGHNSSTRVTHRAMEVIDSGEYFITRGDANDTDDPSPLNGKSLIGKVVVVIPVVGSVFRFLSTKVGISLLVTIVLAWIAIPKLLARKGKENL